MSKLIITLGIVLSSFSLKAGINKGGNCKLLHSTKIIKIEKLSLDQKKVAPLTVSKIIVKCNAAAAEELIQINTKSIRDTDNGQIINGGYGFKAQALILDEKMNIIDKKESNHYFFLRTSLKNGSFLQINIEGFSQTLISL